MKLIECLEMAKNGSIWLESAAIARNGWKWLETDEMAGMK